MGREIVHYHADYVGFWEMDIGKVAHAVGEVLGRPPVGDLHVTPGFVCVDKNEQIGRAITTVFAVEALQLPRLGRDGPAHLADQLGGAFVEADDRTFGIGFSA